MTAPHRPGLHIQGQGHIWQTLVTLNQEALSVCRFRMGGKTGGRSVSVELDIVARTPSVFAGGIGVLTEENKTALEAFLGESLEVWFARERDFPPVTVRFEAGQGRVWLAGRELSYLTSVELWADFKEEDTVWVRWEGYAGDPYASDDPPRLTVQGHVIALAPGGLHNLK